MRWILHKARSVEALFAGLVAPAYIVIDPMAYMLLPPEEAAPASARGKGRRQSKQKEKWQQSEDGMRAEVSEETQEMLEYHGIAYTIVEPPAPPDAATLNDLLGKFESVKRWYEHDWSNIETKLRTSIVEGISVFLSLFDDNPQLKRIFCPPQETYDPIANHDGRFGIPLPDMSSMIESGQVLALNFPLSSNAATGRLIACLLKMEYQRAMMARIPKMATSPELYWRESLFLCDEYHQLATVGESDPNGDEKFFALSRQAKCIPIVATQSISSLRSTLPGESWRTLIQCFRTKVFLANSDKFTAQEASDMAGRTQQMTRSYSMSENGQDVRVSMTTGKAQAHKAGLTMNQSYSEQFRPLFEPKLLMELGNAQAVVLPYDGVEPLPPTMCLLKPHYLDRNISYFEQRERNLI